MTTAEWSSNNIDLDNPEFLRLWDLIEFTDQSVFLTGKAGTGKSTFLRYIIDHTAKEYVILAPTGLAAVNVGGQTLHSFFHIPLQPILPDDPEFAPERLRNRLSYSPRLIKALKQIELIVIDEISMVRADVIDFIDKILRQFGGDKRRPFGGKQLLLVGDVFQLEPVVTADDRALLGKCYRNFFFFNASVFSSFGLVAIELLKVYRQKENSFVELLDRIRSGNPGDSDLEAINSRLLPVHATEAGAPTPVADFGRMVMTLAARRESVKIINDFHLKSLDTPEITFTGEVSGEFPESAYPTDMQLTLKVGAQVIFLRNDIDRRWVNGTLGIVTAADPDEGITVRLESGAEYAVEKTQWENVSYEYDTKKKSVSANVKGTFTQYPLKAAWALTIHKSQGLTFDNLIIDLGFGGAFTGGQVYVALSRCTSLEGISLMSPVARRDVFISDEIIRFSRNFNDETAQRKAITEAKADELLEDAMRLLRRKDIVNAMKNAAKALELCPSRNTPLLQRYAAIRLTAALKKL